MSTTSNLDGFTREYSQRLGVLTGAQLQAALDRSELGELRDATPVKGGLFGQNVFLTSSTGEYVLRGKPHYDWQFPAERFFARLIHQSTGVPVPWPYQLEEETDIFGWPYVLMPKLPGVTLSDFAGQDDLGGPDGIAVSKALGTALAELHRLEFPSCGEYELALNGIQSIDGSYRDWIAGRLSERISRCLSEHCITRDEAAWCQVLIKANVDSLDVPFTPTVAHHDYKRGNVTVQRAGDVWRVSGIFDLMECYAGDGEEDLVRSMFDVGVAPGQRARAFVQTYASARPLRDGFRERFRLHVLRDALLIWGFEHRHGRTPAPDQSFRQWAEPYVSFDPFAA